VLRRAFLSLVLLSSPAFGQSQQPATLPDGEYLQTVTSLSTSPPSTVASWRFWVGPIPGPTPSPTPTPGPAPTPDPSPSPSPVPPKPDPIVAPVVGPIYATLFYSLSDPPAAIKQAGLEDALGPLDCTWHSYDDKAQQVNADGSLSGKPYIDAKGYRPVVDKAGGTPCVVIQDAGGKVLATMKSPKPEDVLAKIKALRTGGAK
jgi:hypothetical protein